MYCPVGNPVDILDSVQKVWSTVHELQGSVLLLLRKRASDALILNVMLVPESITPLQVSKSIFVPRRFVF
jgi:hypothetical protein